MQIAKDILTDKRNGKIAKRFISDDV